MTTRSSKRLRAAVIGLGVGEQHLKAYIDHPNCDVVWAADFDEAKLNEMSKKYPFVEFVKEFDSDVALKNLDLISVTSYDNFHAMQVIAALKRDIHVFVEKPLCLSELELSAICKVKREKPKLKLASNLVLRKAKHLVDLRKRVLSGALGEIYHFEGDYDYGRVHKLSNGWRGKINDYSVMHGGGIHLLDLAMWVVGGRISEVAATGNKIVTAGMGNNCNDLVVALLKFESGQIGKVTANFGSVTKHSHKLAVYGTKGTFFQNLTNSGYHTKRDDVADETYESIEVDKPSKQGILSSFVESILTDVAPAVSAQDVVDVMAVSISVEKAVLSGRWEPVSYLSL